MFVPTMFPAEAILWGTMIYFAVCLLLRIILKRQAGKVALSDLLVIVLVAGVCRNPLVRDAYSIPDGLMVIAVILFWSFAVDWLSYRSRFVHGLFHSPPIPLIRNGQVLYENLRRELMTEERLCAKLREHGVTDPRQVAEAYMEGDGKVSVIKKEEMPRHDGAAEADTSAAANGRPAARHECVSPAVSRPENYPAEAGDSSVEVETFLRAAKHIQERIAWQERQITAYQAEVAGLKDALARHGLRTQQEAHSFPAP
jgi:uncharacterized membrane protein YcaP (DUF421 family)